GVSLVVDTLFPTKALADALGHMHDVYPSVSVHLRTAPLGEPLAALRDGRCTLAITVGEEFREPQIQLEALSPVPFVVVVSTRHALANRGDRQGPVDPAELADHVQIVQEDATAQTAGK